MKCFNHPDQDAVVTCNHCGKGLCADCTIEMESGGNCCPDCFGSFVNYQKGLLASLRWRLFFFIGVIVCMIIYAFFSVESFTIEVLRTVVIISMFIGSIPIGFYYMKGAPDPYMPTSLQSAGKLVIFNLIVKCIFGPIFVIKAIFDYKKISKAKKDNELVYENVRNSH